ncbi:MAG: nucleoside kinase [Bacilli bacterium]|nr:nucleoside kinase [Bacilli bacterium]
MLSVQVKYNGEKYAFSKGTTLLDISKKFQKDFKDKIIIGEINGILSELSTPVMSSCDVKFYDRNSSTGNKVYELGLIFILVKIFNDRFNKDIKIIHALDKGVYIKCNDITEKDLELVTREMNRIIDVDIPIDKLLINRKEAIKYYSNKGIKDKVELLKFNTNTNINLYKLDNVYDYYFYNLPISTGYLNDFKLHYLDENSFVLLFRNIYNPKLTYKHRKKMFDEFERYYEFCSNIGINTVSDLNKTIINSKINDIIMLSELHQNNNLFEIAKDIYSRKSKIILISGPSSSGKTTTSKKLGLYLKTFGLNPKTISIDDYFVARKETPKKEDGTYDFECLGAVDTKLFNKHLEKLLSGEKVKCPTYNFITGEPEYVTEPMELEENDILLIEGLHALNDELTKNISSRYKYKIYISPLPILTLDNHNRIKMTDVRLLRRMVRDNETRGYNASDTLCNWPSVREGEEKNVFPFEEEADAVFNTTLVYELSILKTYAEPLLYAVDESDENYKDVVRLLNLLKLVLPISSENIPRDSIIREFIGNSIFK